MDRYFLNIEPGAVDAEQLGFLQPRAFNAFTLLPNQTANRVYESDNLARRVIQSRILVRTQAMAQIAGLPDA